MGKIIIFGYDYPPNNGGISRLCGEIRKELLHRGINVQVVTCAAGEQQSGVFRVNARRGVLEFKLRKCLKDIYKPGDIVLTDTWHPAGTIALTVTKDVFILAHGAELLTGQRLRGSRIWHRYRRRILRKAKGVIANSHYTDGLVRECSPKANSIAIPLAIDAEYFHPTVKKNSTDDILRICSLARLSKFKGHDFIIRTIAKLPEKYRQRLKFEIGGKGEYKETLERLTDELGLRDTVKFLGFMPDEDVMDFYSRNDLFILCTREEPCMRNVEGFGLVFTEAQACGTVAIGTNSGGIPDAIDTTKAGWLISQDSETELLELLKYAIDHKSEIHVLGEKSRKRVIDDCNWQQYCDILLEFIGNV